MSPMLVEAEEAVKTALVRSRNPYLLTPEVYFNKVDQVRQAFSPNSQMSCRSGSRFKTGKPEAIATECKFQSKSVPWFQLKLINDYWDPIRQQ